MSRNKTLNFNIYYFSFFYLLINKFLKVILADDAFKKFRC